MTETFYDANQAPNAAIWMALSEVEQIRLIRNYHERSGERLPDSKQHFFAHLLLEKEIASGHGPTKKALTRLIEQGRTRHEAMHLIIPVLMNKLAEQWKFPPTKQTAQIQKSYNEALLTLETKITQ